MISFPQFPQLPQGPSVYAIIQQLHRLDQFKAASRVLSEEKSKMCDKLTVLQGEALRSYSGFREETLN